MSQKQGKKLPKRVGNQHRKNKRELLYKRGLKRREEGGKRIHMRRTPKEQKTHNVLEFPVPRPEKGKMNPGRSVSVRSIRTANKQEILGWHALCHNCRNFSKKYMLTYYSMDVAFKMATYAARDHDCIPSEWRRPDTNEKPRRYR